MAYKSEITKMGGAAALDQEVESGKAMIAQAINAKGGTSSADESMAELADDVLEIPINIQVEDAANLAFPENIAWNILKEAYAQQRVGYASWIVAEFFKGYDTIPLSGADAFYTCDGDFYTEATTHTWHDDSFNKVNRYVIYYFTGENIPFSVTQESVCPRSMVIMGKFSSINIASTGRIRQIYNGGEIGDISFSGTNPAWGQEVMLAGVKEHNSGYILNANANVQILASDIEVLNGGNVIYNSGAELMTVMFPNLNEIKGGRIINAGSSFPQLKTVELNNLTRISGGYLISGYNTSATFPNVEKITLPNLERIVSTGRLFNISDSGGTYFLVNLKELLLSSLIECKKISDGGTNMHAANFLFNLIKVELGEGFNGNFNFKREFL